MVVADVLSRWGGCMRQSSAGKQVGEVNGEEWGKGEAGSLVAVCGDGGDGVADVKGDEMWPVVVKMYDLARKAVALQLSQVERVHVQFIAKLLLR